MPIVDYPLNPVFGTLGSRQAATVLPQSLVVQHLDSQPTGAYGQAFKGAITDAAFRFMFGKGGVNKIPKNSVINDADLRLKANTTRSDTLGDVSLVAIVDDDTWSLGGESGASVEIGPRYNDANIDTFLHVFDDVGGLAYDHGIGGPYAGSARAFAGWNNVNEQFRASGVGQWFRLATGIEFTLGSANIGIQRIGTPPGTVTLEVWPLMADDGTDNRIDLSGGVPLAASDAITASTLPASSL